MNRHPHVHYRLLAALFVGIVAVPMTSTALFLNQESLETLDFEASDLRRKALENRRELRAQRRSYWRAMEQYQRAEEAGGNAVKPDINNMNSIDRALHQNENEEPMHEAAPDVTSLSTNELLPQDKALLRRYTRARSCPESLKNFRVPGFFELCNALVGVGASPNPVRGILNNKAYIRGALQKAAPDVPAFKLRMQMLEQANDPNRRRDGGVMPSRPTTCANNPDCLEPRYSN